MGSRAVCSVRFLEISGWKRVDNAGRAEGARRNEARREEDTHYRSSAPLRFGAPRMARTSSPGLLSIPRRSCARLESRVTSARGRYAERIMNRAMLVVALIVLVVLAAASFWDPSAVATSAARPWPGGLGTLDSVTDRFPPHPANDAALRLAVLAEALPKEDGVLDFVSREVARGELAIGEPPTLPDVAASRELLLGEPIVWERRVAFDDVDVGARRVLQMRLARALVAAALTKAREGDPAAWEDLRAAWVLARSLDGHPQTMAQTAALTIARMINAVAWKMPLPAPPWLGELTERDAVPPLLEAFQYQAASYWQDTGQMFPTSWLATSIEHDRSIAEELVDSSAACEVTPRMNQLGTDLSSVWRRAFRYRAEREATANALRIREGKLIATESACSGDTWTSDGTTLRFSREIPAGTSDMSMPLELRIEQ
jgi:hypothetical protein